MYSGKRHFRAFACMALALSVFLAGPGAAAQTLEELQKEHEELQRQQEETDSLLDELGQDTQEKKAYRDALYEQIGTVQQQLDQLREQIAGLDAKIAQAEDQAAEKLETLQRSRSLLKERIRALYVAGDASSLELILDSRDLLDLTERAQLLKAVTQHDQELIADLARQLEELRLYTEEIGRDKEELGRSKKEMDSKGAELAQLYAAAQSLVEDAENRELAARTGSELLGSRLQENEEAIAQLEKEIQQQDLPSVGGYEGTGSFIWPMPGYTYLTCYFGEGGHRGIDIAGGDIYGKPIVAADGGTVTYAGWNDSYGWCVFIDHGNGYETRYAHMCQLGTETGAQVEQGQILGYAGSTGNSTGPHLHFEVISGGALTDPMGYF